MQITVSGRHMGVSDAVKAYCDEKAGKLTRYYDRIQAIEVILDGKSGVHEAEMIIHLDGAQPLIATEQREDIYAAIDVLVDKLERQLTKLKEKLRNRKHPPHAAASEPEVA